MVRPPPVMFCSPCTGDEPPLAPASAFRPYALRLPNDVGRQQQPPPTRPFYNSHSISGMIFFLSTTMELVHFMLTREKSDFLRLLNLGLAIGLYVGTFREEIQRHKAPLGLALNRLGSWIVAFVALSMSMYTTSGEEWLIGEVRLINMIGTVIFPLALLDSMTVLYEEIRHGHIFLQGFVMENMANLCALLALPLYRLWNGADVMTYLYVDQPMAETVYVLSIFTATITGIEAFAVRLVSTGKLSVETFNDAMTIVWGLVHAPVSAILVGSLNGVIPGATYYAGLFCLFLFATFLEFGLEKQGWLACKPLTKPKGR